MCISNDNSSDISEHHAVFVLKCTLLKTSFLWPPATGWKAQNHGLQHVSRTQATDRVSGNQCAHTNSSAVKRLVGISTATDKAISPRLCSWIYMCMSMCMCAFVCWNKYEICGCAFVYSVYTPSRHNICALPSNKYNKLKICECTLPCIRCQARQDNKLAARVEGR